MNLKIAPWWHSVRGAGISAPSRSAGRLSQRQSGSLSTTAPGEGGWYSRLSPEPVTVFEAWRLPWHEATIMQYVIRWRAKNGVEDLKKARWYLDRLIVLAESEATDGAGKP